MNKMMTKLAALSLLGLTAGSAFAMSEASASPAVVSGIYAHQDDPFGPGDPGPVVQSDNSNSAIGDLIPLEPGPVVNPDTKGGFDPSKEFDPSKCTPGLLC